MFKKILVANRGEIACRIIRSCKKLGLQSIAVYSDIDKNKTEVHLEIWIGNDNKTATVNPEIWLRKQQF